MIKKLRDDSGVAMVTAIMAGLVVTTLSTVGFSLATHNLDASSAGRRNIEAIHGAEAGLDAFLEYLANSAPIIGPACSLPSGQLATTSGTTYSVTAKFYSTVDGTDADVPSTLLGSSASCPTTFASVPLSAIITSQATTAGKTRTMETRVELQPNTGSTIARHAVYANGVATWTGQAHVENAAGTELPADLYSNEDIELKGGGTVYGTVESQKKITLSGTAEVKRDVVARGLLTIGNNAIVRQDARSSQNAISSGGTVNGTAYYCTGPAPGGTVGGGRVQECRADLPASIPFKQIGFDAAVWSDPSQNPSYTVRNYSSCPSQADFTALPTGNTAMRITGCSALTLPNVNLKGHLAIVATGDINGTGSTTITRVGSTPTYTLHLLANVPTSPSLADPATCSTNAGITMAAGVAYPPAVDVLFYTPCDVKFTGNATSNIQGQIVAGGDVDFASGSSITYKPLLIPTTNPIGFRESVRYRSEVVD